MNLKNILYLASTSKSRQALLNQAEIPFEVVKQEADEAYCDITNIEEVVSLIAKRKMGHVLLGSGKENEIKYVLTADTLCQDNFGKIHGKPTSKEEAVFQIKSISSGPVLISTAFCLEKKVYKLGIWNTVEHKLGVVTTKCEFVMPDFMIDDYISRSNVFNIAGSITIEGYGSQFLKTINGSYSAIIGLPLFEVRQALEEFGFYK